MLLFLLLSTHVQKGKMFPAFLFILFFLFRFLFGFWKTNFFIYFFFCFKKRERKPMCKPNSLWTGSKVSPRLGTQKNDCSSLELEDSICVVLKRPSSTVFQWISQKEESRLLIPPLRWNCLLTVSELAWEKGVDSQSNSCFHHHHHQISKTK